MNIAEIMKNPLMKGTEQGPFLRLVLAEAASYGMPPLVVATLDDIAAMLGMYHPVSSGQSAYMAGPFSTWRSDRRQPTNERLPELEQLALKQRALIVFGGGPEGHLVGTAEIVLAMGNTHRELVPEPDWEVFRWAAADAMSKLLGISPARYCDNQEWTSVPKDDDVLKPGGKYNETYQKLADTIRRAAIGGLKGDPDAPRAMLRPLAEHFLQMHYQIRREAENQGRPELVASITEAIRVIQAMYPGLVVEAQAV